MTTHRATLVFTEDVVRSAVLHFWRRTLGLGFPVAMVVVAACLGVLVWARSESWIVGALGTVLVVGLALAVALYAVHYRNGIRKLRNMDSAQAEFVAEEATFSVSSSLGQSTHPWSLVQELWRFPDCWLLLFSKAQFMTLPLNSLSPGMQDFILQRFRAASGKDAA